jgi:GAF domain-containing protein
MRRRNRELNALNAMAVIATQSFDLDEILNLTLRQVISLFGAETGSVYLAAEPDGTYRRRAGWGPRSEARVRMAEVVFPEGLGDLVMRSRAEVVTQDFLPHLPAAVVEFVVRRPPALLDLGCALEQGQAPRHHGHRQQGRPALFEQR